jgi:uncharacterized protein (TIGR02611 family)
LRVVTSDPAEPPPTPGPTPPRPKIVERLEAQRERYKERSRVVRIAFAVVGFTLLIGGLAMLVLPGPAFVVIPVGLAILSLEFTWAERLLERSLEEAAKAQKKASETTTAQRVLSAIAAALAAGAFIAWAILGDVPLLPV